MRVQLYGLQVEVEEVEHASDPVDCFVQRAYWLGEGQYPGHPDDVHKDLTEEELEALTEQMHEDGDFEESHLDWSVGCAEYLYAND